MNPDTERLYTEEEVQAMSIKEQEVLVRISKAEFDALQSVPYGERTKALNQIRSETDAKKKRKRKAQKQARKRNR